MAVKAQDLSKDYKYGFSDPEQYAFKSSRGLNREIVEKISEYKKVQLRLNGYNFLNHPLWSFNGSNLNLGFDAASGKVNTPLSA